MLINGSLRRGSDQSDDQDQADLDREGDADRVREHPEPGPRGHARDSRSLHGREDDGEDDTDAYDGEIHDPDAITAA